MDSHAGTLDSLLDLADRLGPAEKAPKGAKKTRADAQAGDNPRCR